ncbi:urate hydroxylase PuuD [Methylocapsa aurea]|uniref:urate hydroxylase PuuD n=1 Tax=Methylocapsa aurea TaxID=663610 RepID=UPI000A009B80|nr:urate hydroxylase PuuD [Methylocapsa aurea]
MDELIAKFSKTIERFFKTIETLNGALALGAGFAVVLLVLYHHGDLGEGYWGPFFTFLHVVSGITWIGLLYYFNLVQIPTMPKIPAELKPGIGKYIAPEALFWFRWSAAATVATGLIVFISGTAVINLTILTGALLGLIMAYNVWFIIWPNQQKALGLILVDDEAKAKAARTAMLTSRTNFVLSVPMLYCMVTARLVG